MIYPIEIKDRSKSEILVQPKTIFLSKPRKTLIDSKKTTLSPFKLNSKGIKDLKKNRESKILIDIDSYYISCPEIDEEEDCGSMESYIKRRYSLINDNKKGGINRRINIFQHEDKINNDNHDNDHDNNKEETKKTDDSNHYIPISSLKPIRQCSVFLSNINDKYLFLYNDINKVYSNDDIKVYSQNLVNNIKKYYDVYISNDTNTRRRRRIQRKSLVFNKNRRQSTILYKLSNGKEEIEV